MESGAQVSQTQHTYHISAKSNLETYLPGNYFPAKISGRFATAVLALMFLALPAAGQKIVVGAVGGLNLTSDFPAFMAKYGDNFGGTTSVVRSGKHHTFVGGASVEYRFDDFFALEADILQRTLRVQSTVTPSSGSPSLVSETFGTVEIPVLLKFRLAPTNPLARKALTRPFLEIGPSFRAGYNTGPVQPSKFGGTIGAGLEIDMGRIAFAPVIRYTRWRRDGNGLPITTKPDQVEALVGVNYAF